MFLCDRECVRMHADVCEVKSLSLDRTDKVMTETIATSFAGLVQDESRCEKSQDADGNKLERSS